MNILGMSHLEPFTSYFQDTNIGFVSKGEIYFAALEERYSRLKHHAGFPIGALKELEKNTCISISNCDVIALSENRKLSSAQITNSSSNIFTLGTLAKSLRMRGDVFMCDHQLSHASVAFRLSPFDDALVVTLDGMGHDLGQACYGAVFKGSQNTLTRLKTCWSEGNSLGLFYGMATEALGWKISDGEGKTMALATSGNPSLLYDEILKYAPNVSRGEMVGGYRFNPVSAIVNHHHYLSDPSINELRILANRAGRENLAAAVQLRLEEVIVDWIGMLLAEYSWARKVCLGGGVFLNVVANSRLRKEFPKVDFFVPSNPSDGGIGLGAALEAAAQSGASRPTLNNPQYLGSEYKLETTNKLDSIKFKLIKYDDPSDAVAEALEMGKVVGLYQGRSEWGPRALGNRSVLAHPGLPNIRNRINSRMKQRELFMPFAPSILEETLDDWFYSSKQPSPYMMFTYQGKPDSVNKIKAVLHNDDTARPQTVTENDNPLLYRILNAFNERTGFPLVLNTSFNLHGLPIVETPDDAINHLIWGCVDCVFINNTMISCSI